VSPGQEQCDYCGVWFEKAPESSPIARIMADNDHGDKPKERFVYYTGGITDFGPSVGVSVGGGLSVPLGGGGAHRTVGRITGTVAEETSEYVIIMTRKGQLVKIRPENIIKRELFKPFTFTAERKRKTIRNYVIAGSFFLLVSIPLLATGITLLWGTSAIIGVAELIAAAIVSQRRVEK